MGVDDQSDIAMVTILGATRRKLAFLMTTLQQHPLSDRKTNVRLIISQYVYQCSKFGEDRSNSF